MVARPKLLLIETELTGNHGSLNVSRPLPALLLCYLSLLPRLFLFRAVLPSP